MDLYILRHATAEPPGNSTSGGDSRRALTAEGEQKMRRGAKGMQALKLSFDLILSSPALRATQTAHIVAEVLGRSKCLQVSHHLEADGNPGECIDWLRKHHGGKKRILLVGHQPYLSRLISVLISGGTGMPVNLKKGGLCKLSAKTLRHGRCATLEWLLTLRQMRRMEQAP